MIKSKIWVLFLVMALNASAQKFVSERSVITFFSSATLEDITATNKKSSSIINLTSAEIAFSVPIKSFKFEKQLMQQHFNERYMESETYPKATFAGKIEGLQLNASSIQQVRAIGKLMIHGVTRDVAIPGTIEITSSNVMIKTKFMIKLADYKIEIPKLLWQNIAEQVEVTIEFVYKPQ